jgi:transposase
MLWRWRGPRSERWTYPARLDGLSREVRLLVDHREDLVRERTRIQNRLRWHLHELEPGRRIPAKALNQFKTMDELDALISGRQAPVARVARHLASQNRTLTVAINELEREITGLVTELTPNLLALVGCGPLTAAKLLGEVAGIERFRSRSAFAMHNGTAPIPVWSGNNDRHRLNRGGNRQINTALHRIAITQLQHFAPAIAYVEHRTASGDTKTEAIRALRRRISDAVHGCLVADERLQRGDRGPIHAAA